MRVLSVILLVMLPIVAQSQDIERDTIVWSVDKLRDERADISEAYTCEFITYGNDQIAWIQKEATNYFEPTEVVGSFGEFSADVEKVFRFRYDKNPATLTFTRFEDKWTIAMEVIEGGQNIMPYVFTVSAIKIK